MLQEGRRGPPTPAATGAASASCTSAADAAEAAAAAGAASALRRRTPPTSRLGPPGSRLRQGSGSCCARSRPSATVALVLAPGLALWQGLGGRRRAEQTPGDAQPGPSASSQQRPPQGQPDKKAEPGASPAQSPGPRRPKSSSGGRESPLAHRERATRANRRSTSGPGQRPLGVVAAGGARQGARRQLNP